VLDGLDLEVERGEAVAVMGPSGSGKTTLLHCIAGLRVADAGEVIVSGQEVHRMGRRRRARLRLEEIGLVFQFGELLEELTVAENVVLPLRLRGARTDGVEQLLSSVGLDARAGSWPAELSGGEAQRTAIARAVVGHPAVLLADEPTGALDEELSRSVGLLMRSRAEAIGAALLVATHDPALARSMDRVLRLRNGVLHPA
jgi:ABC-type lipoprotein export system ATPase subunit